MITSLHNTTIKEIMKLKNKKYRDQKQQYLIEGEHLVEEAWKAKQVDCIISTKEYTADVKVLLVSEEVMKKLAYTVHPQSIMAVCNTQRTSTLQQGHRYLLLDNLQDPGNVGTLIRTALAFGFTQVILSPNCVDIYNDKVLRSMQGAHFHISCIYQELQQTIAALQNEKVHVIGSSLENGVAINSIPITKKMALVVGNEGQGMRQSIMQQCDKLAYIPIRKIESLNVAVAGGILMYHFNAY